MIPFTPLKTKRTFEIIVEQIKQKVYSGEYRPGDRLPSERDLSDAMRVGRPAVREAYRALELSGIIQIKKGKAGGAFIRKPTYKSLTESLGDLLRLKSVTLGDLTEARLVLEKDLAFLAIRRLKTTDLDLLENWVEKAFQKLEKGVLATEENVGFHICLANISRNPVLAVAFSSVMDILELYLKNLPSNVEISKHVADDHIRIIQALKSKDFDKLWRLLKRHIVNANDRLMKVELKEADILKTGA